MNRLLSLDSQNYRYVMAVLAGLVLAAAFPDIGLAGLAWISPALLLAAAHGKAGVDAFRIGYVGGLAYFLFSLSWLLRIPATGFPILGWTALSGFLAIYLGSWVWLLAGRIVTDSWWQRTACAFGGAACWVGLEMIRARLLSGFPWNFLGVSQYQLAPLIQIASWTGVYGVSFLVAWVGVSIYFAGNSIVRHHSRRHIWMGDMLLPLVVVIGLMVQGAAKIRSEEGELRNQIRVTFIQPSIPQTMIWNSAENERRFSELLRLTELALTNSTDLVLWPEAAVPKMLRYDEETLRAITRLAQNHKVWLIVGSDDAEPTRRGKTNEADYFNASFLINPEGVLAARYCKQHLVAFGEYIPLAESLPLVKWLTPIDSGFVPGTEIVPFSLESKSTETNSKLVTTATLICFEDVFPHLAREYVNPDTDFLVNLTNDGWFGEGGEQWQHAASALFRAVENGVPLLRCCNNGVTCWIDAHGVLRAILRDSTGDVHGAGVMRATIPLLNPGQLREPTFYNRHGDWFGWSCVLVTGLVTTMRFLERFSFQRNKRTVVPEGLQKGSDQPLKDAG